MPHFAKTFFTDESERESIRAAYPADVAAIVDACSTLGTGLTADEAIDGFARHSYEANATWLVVPTKRYEIVGDVLRGIYAQAQEVGFREIDGQKETRR